MPFKRGFLIVLAFLAFFALSTTHQAWAQNCAPGNATDAAYQKAAAAAGQQNSNNEGSFWAGMKKQSMSSYCGQAIISLYNSITSTSLSAFGIAGFIGGLLGSAAGQIVNQQCNAMVGAATNFADGAATAAANALGICIPMPSFGWQVGNFDFNIAGCSGGTQVPLVAGSGIWPAAPGPSSPWFPPQ